MSCQCRLSLREMAPPWQRRALSRSERRRLLLLLFLPVFEPLLGIPVMPLAILEDVGVDERARPAAFGREFICRVVQFVGESERHRLFRRRLLPAVVAGEPA